MNARSIRRQLVAPFLMAIGILAISAPIFCGGLSQTRAAEANNPAALLEDYVAAVNAGDLEAILALYNDDAFHIMLPSADGSGGVCVGKEQFRMWYEMSLANDERMTVDEDSITIDGNQATFIAHLTSEPWSKLGVEELEATSEIVVIDGRIATHVVALTPESVRELQAAEAKAAA